MAMAEKRKAADNNSPTNMNKKVKENEDDDDDDQNYENAMADDDTYTSQLPDLVIYQILLVLPIKRAIWARLLSKQWAHVWSTVSVADFDESKHSAGAGSLNTLERRQFINLLARCLKQRKQDKHLDRFRLRMRYSGGPGIIDRWLSFAVERNVKEVDISLENMNRKLCLLCHALLNAKSLTILTLEKVRIAADTTHPISLPSLKTMSLKGVGLSASTFSRLISGCPSLEFLSLNSLTQCDGRQELRHFKVSGSMLKSLEIIQMHAFQVEAMNLESFRFSGQTYKLREEDFNGNATCRTLRNLEFFSVGYLGRWLEVLDSKFPFLEHLVLHECYRENGSFNIFSQHLKHLEFCGINVETIKINTPNLLSFRFDGYCLPIGFSMTAPNLWQATILLRWDSRKKVFFHRDYKDMRKFIGNFDGCTKISLSVRHAEALIFPKIMRICPPLSNLRHLVSPLPNLKHLNLEIVSSTYVSDISDLKNSLRWMAPSLEILSVKMNSFEILNEYS